MGAAPTVADVAAAWNSPRNLATREATAPPRGPIGPFRVIGGGRDAVASPEGPYEVHVGVGVSRTFVSSTAAPVHPCLVFFWYATGYRGGPAMVALQARRDLSGFDLDVAVLQFGINTDVRGAPLATHRPDGSLVLVRWPGG
jgi:hypothetical protein